MTPKQERFVQEYLIDLNAAKAARRAGYSARTADRKGPFIANLPAVKAAIEVAMERRSRRTEITADRVLEELAKIGFLNMLDYVTVQDSGDAFVDLSAMTREQAAAIQEIAVDEYTEGRGDEARNVKRTKIKLADKRAALVDIGRHLGMFRDRIEHSGPNGGPIDINRIERVVVDPQDTDR